jgi:RND family efflux transporter MFP subunit
MNKKTLSTLAVIAVIAALGIGVTRQISTKKAAAETPKSETAVVQHGDLSITVDASGSLLPQTELEVAFTSSGQVAKLLVAEGDLVQAGQPLLRLDTQDLEWQVEQARLSLTLAELDLSEARDWYAESDEPVQIALAILDQAQISLQQAEWRLAQATLEAPISSIVTAVLVDQGEVVGAGQTVVVLSDHVNLEVEVNLDQTDVVRIVQGKTVAVTLDAFPGIEMSGEVIEIAPSADIQSGVVLYPVTVRLDPTDLSLRLGMTANVTFPIEQHSDTLLVPFRAVETEGGQAYVTRVTGLGSERVAVTLGLITDTQVEILGGLETGDVVTVYANPIQDAEVMNNPMFGGGH